MRRRFLFAALPLLGLAACQMPSSGPAPRTVVFFTADSAALDENATALVADAAERARARRTAPVRVRGFAAPDTGTPAYNRSLAEARAQTVTDALVANGIDRSRIRLQPRGEVPFEMYPTESRRVEIILGD
jgi:outer membrane protein OmpA-like peptidoglycan-associated protein